jgi:3-oxoacyl-[acyl-carrier protein] reductase
VVTGVAKPGQLGDFVARAFAANGDRVSIVARSPEAAEERAAQMRTDGLDVHPFACDLADPASTLQLAAHIHASAGRVDVLINLAGGFAMSGPVAESDPVVWAQQISINLGTAYATTRAFLPALRESRGSIVFVASAAALPGARVKNTAAYAVAKTGVLTLMRAVAQEEQARGVRANAIAPGSIRTHDNVAAMPDGTKFVEPEAVANAIRFLCSPEAAQVTGQVIELTV